MRRNPEGVLQIQPARGCITVNPKFRLDSRRKRNADIAERLRYHRPSAVNFRVHHIFAVRVRAMQQTASMNASNIHEGYSEGETLSLSLSCLSSIRLYPNNTTVGAFTTASVCLRVRVHTPSSGRSRGGTRDCRNTQ